MRSALGREGEVTAVDRAPGGQGVKVRMDEGGDAWWFHPGALESIIPREARASSIGSPVVSHGATGSPSPGRASPSTAPLPPPPSLVLPPPPPAAAAAAAAASKGPPPPATLLANGLIELVPLWSGAEHPGGLPAYGKPSFAAGAGVVARVADVTTRVQVVDMRCVSCVCIHMCVSGDGVVRVDSAR